MKRSPSQCTTNIGDSMEDQHGAEIGLEMDIADFSGKIVNRIDIQNVVGRTDSRKAGCAIIMSFTDGSTGTILVRTGDGTPIVVTPYRRPRMGDYAIVTEDTPAPT